MRHEWFERATSIDPMGEVARAVDWAATSWGPPEDWAPGLRSAVEICMSTRFPVLVTWGPDLLMLYNEGYRAMLGTDKQRGAMGRPVLEVWEEIRDDIAPLFQHVLDTGRPVFMDDMTLRVNRSGYVEDAVFSFCYSAIRDEAGQVQGVLDISHETTAQVVARRRLALVSTLSTELHDANGDLGTVGRLIAEALGRSPDVGAAELCLVVDDRLLTLSRAHVRDVDLVSADVSWDVVRSRQPRLDGDTLVSPLASSTADSVVGVLTLRTGTGRVPDPAELEFLELLASTVASALGSAVRHITELGELRHVSLTLQESMLPTLTATEDAVARYLPATGSLAVGGDWYDSIDQDSGGVALVVGDCVGHGLAAAAVMAQLRTASRTLLLEGHGPATMLAALDKFAVDLPAAQCATVVCSTLNPRNGELVYSSAGHLPALVVGDRGHRWLAGGRGVPLGVQVEWERADALDVLELDEVLLVFTDGLVERRDEPIDQGLARLAGEVTELIAGIDVEKLDLEELVDSIIGRLVPGGSTDDIALIAQRRPR
ncbi:MAG: SpoIIE family protein phosphatase [Candidatus Nanopelagicales bacterium]